MAVKTAEEVALEFAQASLSLAPVIILGSGASAAHGIPAMGPLAAHFETMGKPPEWGAEEITEWERLLAKLAAGADLETALQSIRPSERQTQFIAAKTRAFLLPSDTRVFSDLLTNRHHLPLSRLYKHLFDSTHTTLNVVTPNYDRIAEYAADAADICTFNGFNYGYLRTRARHPNTRVMVEGRPARTVFVWKVHGSLDWFQDHSNQIIAAPNVHELPEGLMPLMVTPGLDKYRLTHAEPFRTIMASCDSALERARAYLCIGYGFNDEHLQTKLIDRCDGDAVPLLVITKALTTPAKALLRSGRCRKYLAIEEAPSGSVAYMHDAPKGFVLDDQLWRLDRFLDKITGH